LREQEEIKRRFRALDLVETRERRSLQTTLGSEKFQDIARAPERRPHVRRDQAKTGPLRLPPQVLEKIKEAARARTGPLTLPQQQKLEAIKETAREMTAPPPAAVEKEKEKQKGKGKGALRSLFNRMADMFSGAGEQAGGGPKQKDRGGKKREPVKEKVKPARDDIDQEAMAEFFKTRDVEREQTPQKKRDFVPVPTERTAELNKPAEPVAEPPKDIDQEGLKEYFRKHAGDKDRDKTRGPGRDRGR
jgi:hypothetical protein